MRLPQVRPLRHDREGGHVLPSPAKHLQRKDLHHDVGLVHRAGNFVRRQSRLPRLGRLAEVDENEFDHGKLSPLATNLVIVVISPTMDIRKTFKL